MDEIFTYCGWTKTINKEIKIPTTKTLFLADHSNIRNKQILKQKTLSKILIPFRLIALTKKDWKKACPPKTVFPTADSLLPKIEPVSNILTGCKKYFWKSSW